MGLIIIFTGMCRIDVDFIIKVADFGLSERLYSGELFQAEKGRKRPDASHQVDGH